VFLLLGGVLYRVGRKSSLTTGGGA